LRIFWWRAIKLHQYKVQHLRDWRLTFRYACHLSRVCCPKQLTIGPTSIAWYSTKQHPYHAAFPRAVCSRDVKSALNGTCGTYGTDVSIMRLAILLKTNEFPISTNGLKFIWLWDFIYHLSILWRVKIMNPHFILPPRPKYRLQSLDFENNPWFKHWGAITFSVTKSGGSKLSRHFGKCTSWHFNTPDNATAQPVTFPQGGKTRFTRGLLRKWNKTLQPAI